MIDYENNSAAYCRAWDNSLCSGTENCQPRCPRFFDEEGIPITFRPYQSNDRDALMSMYEEIHASGETFGLPPRTDVKTQEWLTHLTSNGWNLVAVHDDLLVGHIGAAPDASNNPRVVVFVHPNYQRRGIGTELMKQLIAHSERREYKSLTLSVAYSNRGMIKLAKNLGFSVTERLSSECLMELSLEDQIVDQVQQPPVERN